MVSGLASSLVLGVDWLAVYNPTIDWKNLVVTLYREDKEPVCLSGVAGEVGSASV